MNLSLGEYQALAAKALRGVGYSWGMTEDGAFALGQLERQGFATGSLVLELLFQVDSSGCDAMTAASDWRPAGETLCPLSVGTSIADRSGCRHLSLGPTVTPLLVAPFLALTLGDESEHYVVSWNNSQCFVSSTSIDLIGALPSNAVPLTIVRSEAQAPQRSNAQPPAAGSATRVTLDESTVAGLHRFAHRVYAPATEQSRAGAGAGTTDND